eukprot:1272756-Karenia_brevis.AAC.1
MSGIDRSRECDECDDGVDISCSSKGCDQLQCDRSACDIFENAVGDMPHFTYNCTTANMFQHLSSDDDDDDADLGSICAECVPSCLNDFNSQGIPDNVALCRKEFNIQIPGGDESTLQSHTQNGIKTCITCRFCGSGSGICARRLCDLCGSMLCAQCVEAHSTVVQHNGKTACQLWAANDHINMN